MGGPHWPGEGALPRRLAAQLQQTWLLGCCRCRRRHRLSLAAVPRWGAFSVVRFMARAEGGLERRGALSVCGLCAAPPQSVARGGSHPHAALAGEENAPGTLQHVG